jgi:hypothetical protein
MCYTASEMSTASEGKRLLGLIRNPQGGSRQIDGGTLFMRQRTPWIILERGKIQ